MAIAKYVQVLLDRMEQFPEEFLHQRYSAVKYDIYDLTAGTKWEHVTEMVMKGNTKYTVFTEDEVEAYRAKLGSLLRNKFEQDICEALVEGTGAEKQGELDLDHPVSFSTTRVRHGDDAITYGNPQTHSKSWVELLRKSLHSAKEDFGS